MSEIVKKHSSTFFSTEVKTVLAIDGEQHTFQDSFAIDNDVSSSVTYPLPSAKALLSLTIYIEDDGLGPILVNPYLSAGNYKHQLGNPETIFDGEGHNAVRFSWTGSKPMAGQDNNLVIQYANYSGSAIKKITFVGLVQ